MRQSEHLAPPPGFTVHAREPIESPPGVYHRDQASNLLSHISDNLYLPDTEPPKRFERVGFPAVLTSDNGQPIRRQIARRTSRIGAWPTRMFSHLLHLHRYAVAPRL
jgi:hypothetical protein